MFSEEYLTLPVMLLCLLTFLLLINIRYYLLWYIFHAFNGLYILGLVISIYINHILYVESFNFPLCKTELVVMPDLASSILLYSLLFYCPFLTMSLFTEEGRKFYSKEDKYPPLVSE